MKNTVKVEKANKREIQDLIIAGVLDNELLQEKAGKLNLKEAEALAQVMGNVYATILLEGKKAPIADLGYLEPKPRQGRPGVNQIKVAQLVKEGMSKEEAKAQSKIDIPASVGIGFKPSKGFKDEMNGK